jgi:hypothetical protein
LSLAGSFTADVDAGLEVSSDDDNECILPPGAPRVESSGDVDAETLAPLLTLPLPPPPTLVMVEERVRV